MTLTVLKESKRMLSGSDVSAGYVVYPGEASKVAPQQ